MSEKGLPRGLRNNNPGNIRHSADVFQGEVKGADGAFKTFVSMPYGYRAMFRILGNYVNKFGCNTIDKIIHRWAPTVENHTESYIVAVCRSTGKGRGDVIVASDRVLMCGIVAAMSRVENGVGANFQDVERGWELLNVRV